MLLRKFLHGFNMRDAKSVSIPIAPHFKPSSSQCPSSDEDTEYMTRILYSCVVGSLIYVMVYSRPATSLISRYMA